MYLWNFGPKSSMIPSEVGTMRCLSSRITGWDEHDTSHAVAHHTPHISHPGKGVVVVQAVIWGGFLVCSFGRVVFVRRLSVAKKQPTLGMGLWIKSRFVYYDQTQTAVISELIAGDIITMCGEITKFRLHFYQRFILRSRTFMFKLI